MRSGGNNRPPWHSLRRSVFFCFLDHTLIQQIEEMTSGETVHYSSNLVGAYRAAHMAYLDTGDSEFLPIASKAERELRILLTKLRHQRAVFTRWI